MPSKLKPPAVVGRQGPEMAPHVRAAVAQAKPASAKPSAPAFHVQAALAQAKPAPGRSPAPVQPLSGAAPHVQSALAAVAQPKTVAAGPKPAPHVQSALAAVAQPKAVAAGPKPAPHVQAALSAAQARSAGVAVQSKPREGAPSRPVPHVHAAGSQGKVVQARVSLNSARGTRIVITDHRASDYGSHGTVLRRSRRRRDHLVVEFDDGRGGGYRVHIDDMDYLEEERYRGQSHRTTTSSSSAKRDRAQEYSQLIPRLHSQLGRTGSNNNNNNSNNNNNNSNNNNNNASASFANQDAQNSANLSLSQWEEIPIDLTTEQIQQVWDQTGVIKLRNTSNANIRKLVIGCGNRPFPEEVPWEEDDHDHSDAYTIDPNILMRPTVAAFFGSQSVAGAFQAGHFQEIVFEGVRALTGPADVARNPYLASDLTTLLAENGQARVPIGMDGMVVVVTKRNGQLIIIQPDDYAGQLFTDFLNNYAKSG